MWGLTGWLADPAVGGGERLRVLTGRRGTLRRCERDPSPWDATAAQPQITPAGREPTGCVALVELAVGAVAGGRHRPSVRAPVAVHDATTPVRPRVRRRACRQRKPSVPSHVKSSSCVRRKRPCFHPKSERAGKSRPPANRRQKFGNRQSSNPYASVANTATRGPVATPRT